jgi:hypothetical protein
MKREDELVNFFNHNFNLHYSLKPVPVSQRNQFMLILETIFWRLFTEIIPNYCSNYTKHMITPCDKLRSFLLLQQLLDIRIFTSEL